MHYFSQVKTNTTIGSFSNILCASLSLFGVYINFWTCAQQLRQIFFF